MKTEEIVEFIEQGMDDPARQVYVLEQLAENQEKIAARVESTLSAAERIAEMAVSAAKSNADDARKWREIGADATVVLRDLARFIMPNGRFWHTIDCQEVGNSFSECTCGYGDALNGLGAILEVMDNE